MGNACNALDSDEPLETSLPQELPRMQRLYVLASFLMLFLQSMPDGVVTAALWTTIDAYLSDCERAKTKPSADDKRIAIQEILAQAPSHNISFILITSMLERISQEIAGTKKQETERPLSPTKRASPLRLMVTLGRLPEAPVKEQAGSAMAKVFADAMVRTSATLGDKARAAQDRRRVEVIETFLKREDPG